MPLTFDSVCLRCAGAWDAYSVANITKYMNGIGLGFCEFFDDDDSNEVCATYYGLLFAELLILIFGATIIVRSVQKSLPHLSSLLSLTLRLSLTLGPELEDQGDERGAQAGWVHVLPRALLVLQVRDAGGAGHGQPRQDRDRRGRRDDS